MALSRAVSRSLTQCFLMPVGHRQNQRGDARGHHVHTRNLSAGRRQYSQLLETLIGRRYMAAPVLCVYFVLLGESWTRRGERARYGCVRHKLCRWLGRPVRRGGTFRKLNTVVRKLNTVNECESKVHRVCRVVRGFRVTGKGVADCEVSLMHRCRYSRWRTRTVVPSHLVYDNQHHRRRLRMPTLGSLLLRGELMAPCAIHHRAITRITR